jgi:signal transduction histidine kinase
LLLNAKQATDNTAEAQISVKVSVEEDHVEIAIEDNGIGIDTDQQARIFTPYFTTKSSGSGIGLSVVRQIIEKHIGSIRFESTPNQGTTFYIRLTLLSERS